MKSLRRLSQAVFLGLFLYLFIQTGYTVYDELRQPVNIFLRFDPLMLIGTSLAARQFIGLFAPALVLIGLSLILGRFFCAWVCPLGTVFEFFPAARKRGRKEILPGVFKYYFLFFVIISSVFTLQMVWLGDPISLFIRSLTISIFPVVDRLIRPFVGEMLFLPSRPQYFSLGLVTVAVFLGIIFLTAAAGRFWCRSVCSLGALLGLVARICLIKRRVSSSCNHCGKCVKSCPMNCIGEDHSASKKAECILCLNCRTVCPERAVSYPLKYSSPALAEEKLSLTRRHFLFSVAAGVVPVAFLRINPYYRYGAVNYLRPPGAAGEKEFLAKCIRCGECLKVCPNNALQPAVLQCGLEGIYSPVFAMRLGWCGYNCNLCGQVCPSGAIENLVLAEKQKFVIGIAVIDQNRCYPWYQGKNCLVCEEHCPVPEKAIKIEEKEGIDFLTQKKIKVKYPHIVEDLCTGCGICETKCPTSGRSAIRVLPVEKDDDYM